MGSTDQRRQTPDRGIDILVALGVVGLVFGLAYLTGRLPFEPPSPTKALQAAMAMDDDRLVWAPGTQAISWSQAEHTLRIQPTAAPRDFLLCIEDRCERLPNWTFVAK
jgi:hypothetical protein